MTNQEIKEILEKQLCLLSEESRTATSMRDFVSASQAMVEIVTVLKNLFPGQDN